MDILTHTISGMAAGALVAGFTKKKPAAQVGIVALSGLGGALPDLDAISLWSDFDATFGRFFDLALPGREIYSGRLWYSHHGFLHSIAAAVLVAVIFAVIGRLFQTRRGIGGSSNSLHDSLHRLFPALIGFVSGFVLHLTEDMLTPAASWGGVRLLWPLKTYIGGTGDIWWWNNYDLFLIATGTLAACFSVLVLMRWTRRHLRPVLLGLFLLGCVLFTVQVAARDTNYAYTAHTARSRDLETESKREQREILGEELYAAMSWLDDRIPVAF